MPKIFAWSDDKRRIVIFMERTQPDQVRPVTLQLDPSRFRQPLDRNFRLQPLHLMLRESRHRPAPFK
jgi:hypothetical protein